MFKFYCKAKGKKMVRLTPELIEDSFQYMNPIREYELSLRGILILKLKILFVKCVLR